MTLRQSFMEKRRKLMKGNKGGWALCTSITFDILSYRRAFAFICFEQNN